ncbi:hypothetical protein IRZ71_19090 [Flavobacterium sp. ANB]|uniref:hypothetical protein n=1 Tax=unclassified Flavobacterium TaxID=196869 RepID=UPI0012B7A9FA|nr:MULTISPECIES: hypothetical protein [unclassified Flavobacterium]MBF4518467.1 hypothetical protein [Flavobacterium sp. ANB]MTD68027.1 hypothetical protein [Flavobacterium sp. LC2016-13]
MVENETKNLENLRKLTARYFNTLNPSNDKTGTYTAQIKFANYFELGCVITNMIKLCILAVDQDSHKISDKNSSINVSLILEMILEMFPMNEFELLSDISEILIADYSSVNKKD